VRVLVSATLRHLTSQSHFSRRLPHRRLAQSSNTLLCRNPNIISRRNLWRSRFDAQWGFFGSPTCWPRSIARRLFGRDVKSIEDVSCCN
jgi:hypothetical protein